MAFVRNIFFVVFHLAINNLYIVSGDHDETFVQLLSSKPNDSYCNNFASFVNKLPNISYTDKMALFGILQSTAPSGTVLLKVTTPKLPKENFPTEKEKDLMLELEVMINRVLFGNDPIEESEHDLLLKANKSEVIADNLAHFPSGQLMRGELYENKSGVHLPEYMHKGHAYLKVTNDYMQTAINAFAIFLDGTIDDVLRLPPVYVLQSVLMPCVSKSTIKSLKTFKKKLIYLNLKLP